MGLCESWELWELVKQKVKACSQPAAPTYHPGVKKNHHRGARNKLVTLVLKKLITPVLKKTHHPDVKKPYHPGVILLCVTLVFCTEDSRRAFYQAWTTVWVAGNWASTDKIVNELIFAMKKWEKVNLIVIQLKLELDLTNLSCVSVFVATGVISKRVW